jgi:hypothetical protein
MTLLFFFLILIFCLEREKEVFALFSFCGDLYLLAVVCVFFF